MKLNCVLVLMFTLIYLAKDTSTKAQGTGDMLYDFSGDSIMQSGINSCFADTQQFFVAGTAATQSVSTLHGFLASFDYQRKLLWSKKMTFPGKYNTIIGNRSIIKLSNNKYLLLGETIDTNANSIINIRYPYFHTFTRNGDSINSRIYKDTIISSGFYSAVSEGATFTTAGYITSNQIIHISGNDYDYTKKSLYICKYDTSLKLIWSKTLLGCPGGYPAPYKIILCEDKQHYLIAGELSDTTNYAQHTYFIKMDTSGNIVWLKKYTKKVITWNYTDVVANFSGGYYFVTCDADTSIGPTSTSSICYGKLSEDGDTVWTKIFSDSMKYCTGRQIEWSTDKQHLLIQGMAIAETVPSIIKLDTNGNIVWYRMPQHVYNFSKPWLVPQQTITNLAVTPDEKYLMTGSVSGNAIPGIYDTTGSISWIMLLDSSGCRGMGDPSCWPLSIPPIKKNASVHIYPNPTNDLLNIEQITPGTQLQLVDVYGRCVYMTTVTQTKAVINIEGLPAAGFVLLLTDPEGSRTSYKVMKQ